MKVWIITETCCNEYISVWRTREAARAEVDRLNADYRAKYGRDHFECEEDDLND